MYKALADAIKDAEREKKSLAQVALAAESRDQGRTVEDIRSALQRAHDPEKADPGLDPRWAPVSIGSA